MSTIQQPVTFENYSYGQQTLLADGSVLNNQTNSMTTDNYANVQKTQYYQVNNGQAAAIQTFNANQTNFQNNSASAQLISQGQPNMVNTTTYLQTPTYSPQALTETTTSNLLLDNVAVTVSTPTSSTSITTNAISTQPINPQNVANQQPNQIYTQTISSIDGNSMNFFPTLPVNDNMKNGQIIGQGSTSSTAYTTIPQNNDQRYPSPPMGAVDINKNQQVAIAAPIQSTSFTNSSPINIVNNTPANGFMSQSVPVNQGALTQAQQNGTMNINMNNSSSYPGQNNGFQQYYNQSFTQTIQGKGQQQTIISSTTNIAANYPTQNNLTNGKLGQNNILTVNQNVVNSPMTMKTNSRSHGKNNEPISLELALKRQKNTEAARRSRMRKVLKMETLENHVKRLEADNKNLSIRLAMLESNRIEWESKEKKLLDKIKDLQEQLTEARKGSENTTEDLKEVKEELNKE